MHFTDINDGAELLFVAVSFSASMVVIMYAMIRGALWDVPLERLAAESTLAGIMVTEAGIVTSLARYYADRQRPHEHDDEDPEADAADRIVPVRQTRTSYSAVVRPEPPAGVNGYRLWVMLRAIANYDDTTLSEETARDYRAVSSRDDYRTLLHWLVDEELYTTKNGEYDNRNGGELTDWCRQLVDPTPAGADADTDEILD